VFERYTEKARRVIFHARYEAIQYGSPNIETEHLLLGLLREAREITQFLPHNSDESIRNQIDAKTISLKRLPPSVDLPLSAESKRVLVYGAEEAECLGHHHIGTEHLLLGLLRVDASFGATMLRERGLALDQLREEIAKKSSSEQPAFAPSQTSLRYRSRIASAPTVEIHGFKWHAETIRERVRNLRQFNWYWNQRQWKMRDLSIAQDGRISFDVSLTADSIRFHLSPSAWKKDLCPICNWELFESEQEPHHSIGYTNGRDWVCAECYEKFLLGPDYFATSHPEIIT
jgi:hypothetical protein